MIVTYRDARVDDAAALDRLFDTSFCDAFAHLYQPEDLQAFLTGFGHDDWRAEIADAAYAFRIAEKDRKAVGYVNVERVCNYCHKKYTYNLLVGDTMMGACRKPGCILKSMRDNF